MHASSIHHPHHGPHIGLGHHRLGPNLCISDHYVVTFRITLPSPFAKPHCLKSFRNLKNIDSTSLSQYLQLVSPPLNPSVNDLMDYYNYNLLSILDFQAQLKTQTVTFSHSTPWFTEELRLFKRTGPVQTTLLHCQTPSHTSPHHNQTVTQCNTFLDFYTSKIRNIRSSFSRANSSVQSIDTPSNRPPKYVISVPLSRAPIVLFHQSTLHPPHRLKKTSVNTNRPHGLSTLSPPLC